MRVRRAGRGRGSEGRFLLEPTERRNVLSCGCRLRLPEFNSKELGLSFGKARLDIGLVNIKKKPSTRAAALSPRLAPLWKHSTHQKVQGESVGETGRCSFAFEALRRQDLREPSRNRVPFPAGNMS